MTQILNFTTRQNSSGDNIEDEEFKALMAAQKYFIHSTEQEVVAQMGYDVAVGLIANGNCYIIESHMESNVYDDYRCTHRLMIFTNIVEMTLFVTEDPSLKKYSRRFSEVVSPLLFRK